MNIILIGCRGCGKTTLGKALASHLWKKFVDVEAQVSKSLGAHATPSTTDAHRLTKNVLDDLLRRSDQILELQAETLSDPACRQAVKEAAGCSRIYLKCRPDVLSRRLGTPPADPAEFDRAVAASTTLCEAVADKVFDVSEVDREGALHHLIRRCL